MADTKGELFWNDDDCEVGQRQNKIELSGYYDQFVVVLVEMQEVISDNG